LPGFKEIFYHKRGEYPFLVSLLEVIRGRKQAGCLRYGRLEACATGLRYGGECDILPESEG
jgi:hypothetical protein